MGVWKKLELEWKILIVAAGLFIAIAWPIQRVFISRLQIVLSQSVDHQLEPVLRRRLASADRSAREAVTARIERARQWEALIPIVIREQRQILFGLSVMFFFVFLLLALWTLKRLTQPLKDLALAVERIGRGEAASIEPRSGGALGRLESTVDQLQDELGVLRERARVAGMEAAWKDIARVMAHEIKNPLTPIRLALDSIEEKSASGEALCGARMETYLRRINTQVDALENLVNQFRSFSREPEARLEPVALRQSLERVAESMQGRLHTIVEGDAAACADRLLLNQALLNIWKNALEAGASGLRATIRSENERTSLVISDNGPGIAKEDCERIFLPYVSFKKGGAGLGLSVVKRLVETMRGTIRLDVGCDPEYTGLTVAIHLPEICPGDCNHE
jgi:signal transduction histidine kinase